MAIKKKAAPPEAAGESAPMWIVSFADLVTLMMSFFVVLYALKQGGEKQQIDTMAALKVTFDPNYIPPEDSPLEWQQAIWKYRGQPGPPFPNHGGNSLEPTDGAEGHDPQVKTIRTGKQIVTGTQITFDANQTDLDEVSLSAIRQIAEKVRGFNNILIVKGHASPDEVALRPDDPGGWNISSARAQRVIAEMVKLGIDRRLLREYQCGTAEPPQPDAYDTASQRKNRRVEVFMTDNTAEEYHPTLTVPATGPATRAEN